MLQSLQQLIKSWFRVNKDINNFKKLKILKPSTQESTQMDGNRTVSFQWFFDKSEIE
jgi:hypothetical protein